MIHRLPTAAVPFHECLNSRSLIYLSSPSSVGLCLTVATLRVGFPILCCHGGMGGLSDHLPFRRTLLVLGLVELHLHLARHREVGNETVAVILNVLVEMHASCAQCGH